MSDKEILRLTLKKKWFDLIASGEKTKEFRDDKPYWRSRLLNKDGSPRNFDEVYFLNGHSSTVPAMRVEFKYMSFSCKSWMIGDHGEELPENFIIIHLGRVL